MRKFILNNFPKFYKAVAFFYHNIATKYIWLVFNRPNGVLVYVGLNIGTSFSRVFYRYKRSIGIEANPINFEICNKRFGKNPSLELYNFASAEKQGFVILSISDNGNDMAASTIASFSKTRAINSSRKIKVPSVNLGDFLISKGVIEIDTYISDIEGLDYTVLKTLKPYLDNNSIKSITCEVVRNGKQNPFDGVLNYERNFDEFLTSKYVKKSSGWGVLKEGVFNQVPDDYNFMDVNYELSVGLSLD